MNEVKREDKRNIQSVKKMRCEQMLQIEHEEAKKRGGNERVDFVVELNDKA